MVAEIYAFDVTVPNTTPKVTPQVSALTIPERIVRKIVVRVPYGPGGFVGFQIAVNGQQQIPINAGAFLVADNEIMSWVYDSPITSGAWQLIAYNTGKFDHTIEVRFEVDLPFANAVPAMRQPVAL